MPRFHDTVSDADVIDAEVVDTKAERESDYYQHFRARVRRWLAGKGQHSEWAEYVLAAPDFLHLLCKLAVDAEVGTAERAKIGAALAYFILPMDLIPEVLTGPAGYVDDVALASFVVGALAKTIDPAIIRRHWAGNGDVLELMQRVLQTADRMVGSGLWAKLKGFVR